MVTVSKLSQRVEVNNMPAVSKLRERLPGLKATSDIAMKRQQIVDTRIQQEYGAKVSAYEKERGEFIGAISEFSPTTAKEQAEYEQSYSELTAVGEKYKRTNPFFSEINKQLAAERGTILAEKEKISEDVYAQTEGMSYEQRYYSGDPSVQLVEKSGGYRFFVEDTGKRLSGVAPKTGELPVKQGSLGWTFEGATYVDAPIYKIEGAEEVIGLPTVSYNKPSDTYSLKKSKLVDGKIELETPIYVRKGAMYLLYNMGTQYVPLQDMSVKQLSKKEVKGDVFSWTGRQYTTPLSVREENKKRLAQANIDYNKYKQQFISETSSRESISRQAATQSFVNLVSQQQKSKGKSYNLLKQEYVSNALKVTPTVTKRQAQDAFSVMINKQRRGQQDQGMPTIGVQGMKPREVQIQGKSGLRSNVKATGEFEYPIVRGSFIGNVQVRKTERPIYNNPFLLQGSKKDRKKKS